MEQTKSKGMKLTGAWKRASESRKERRQTSCRKLSVQIVASMQIVFAVLSLILVVALAMYGVCVTALVIEDPNLALEAHFKDANVDPMLRNRIGLISILWTPIAIFAVDILLQLWASMRLLQATKNGISNTDALKCIQFWWRYTIASTVMYSILLFASKFYEMGFLFLGFRLNFLLCVMAFTMTIKRKLMSARAAFKEAGNPTEVVIAPK